MTTQQLVEQYIPLANKLAYQRKKTLPKFVDIDELRSAAYLGLVEAASRFDPTLGIAFVTFAYPRIFGAIHDYLREQGWMKKNGKVQMLSLDSYYDNSDDCTLKDTIAAKEESETEECFDVITLPLDRQAKEILHGYFIDEYSMREVGEQFGVSESRICQLIKQYKDKIRTSWNEAELYSELAA